MAHSGKATPINCCQVCRQTNQRLYSLGLFRRNDATSPLLNIHSRAPLRRVSIRLFRMLVATSGSGYDDKPLVRVLAGFRTTMSE